MTTWVWRGQAPGGETVTGELAAGNRGELLANLRRRKIVVQSVRPKPKEIRLNLPFMDKITTRDMAVFTRQFATMIDSGLPLIQCLDILSRQLGKGPLRGITKRVMQDIEAGSTLSEALAKHDKAFDELFVSMVSAGEAGGVLDTILLRLSEYIEKIDALKRKVRSAMTYPVVVMVVAMVATMFMLIFIIPTFARMFTDFGAALPTPTRIVLGMSGFVRAWWWVMVAGVAGGLFTLRKCYANPKGRRTLDRFLLRVPVLGDVIRKGAVSRFTRTLGTLISSGVPILDGLEITARTAGNAVVKDAVMDARTAIREGQTIAMPLRESGVFPPMVTQMIAVGEETGALDDMLGKIADFYDEEVDTAVDGLTSIIEPVMIVVMGTMVGGMVMSMYLPIFKMVNVIMAQ